MTLTDVLDKPTEEYLRTNVTASVCSCYLGRGMDPDGRVEHYVVAQLLEQQDAILQIAQVSGKGQHDVQDGSRHVHFGRLRHGGEDKETQ